MKTAGEFLEEAHGAVEKITPAEAITRHGAGQTVFVDVRDSADIEKSGTIAGALRIPRGFIEFAACDTTRFHNPAMQRDAEIVLVCGAGGQAALAGKTLKEMGYTRVFNVGGIGDWEKAGGPMEK